MILLGLRQEVESLTYHEVIAVLLEADEQEADRQRWSLSLKTNNPVETYQEMRERIEEQLAVADGPTIDEQPAPMQNWLRAV